MRPVITSLGGLLYQVKCTCQQQIGWVAVRGELSGCRLGRSGHQYFRLKDEHNAIDAVIFRPARESLHFVPEDGMEVICWGECSLYAPQGRLQLSVELMERVGQGTVAYTLSQRRAQFEAEGLFAVERKKPLPSFPRRIALVTSPTGAALQDLLHVLRRRSPSCSLLVAGSQVQGEGAAAAMAAMLYRLNRYQRKLVAQGRRDETIELIILGRGGGTVEDLWPFNEEILIRAIAASAIPIITGIGHETDACLADEVADARAPTPSAAAEIAVPEETRVRELLSAYEQRLMRGMQRHLQERQWQLQLLSQRLQRQQPSEGVAMRHRLIAAHRNALVGEMRGQLRNAQMRLAGLKERLYAQEPKEVLRGYRMRLLLAEQALPQLIQRRQSEARQRLANLAGRLAALSPLAVLQRGYALAHDRDGRLLRNAAEVTPGDSLTLQLHRGRVEVSVTSIEKAEEDRGEESEEGQFTLPSP